MNIRIQRRENPFLQIDKTPINDERLSPQSLGILTYLLSKPDGWKAKKTEIIKRFRGTEIKTSKNMVETVFRELRKTGYAKLVPVFGKGGRIIGSEYLISEVPEHLGTEVPISPGVGDIPSVGDVGRYSNNESSFNKNESLNNISLSGAEKAPVSEKTKQGPEAFFLTAISKIEKHLAEYPDTMEMIRAEGKATASDADLMAEMSEWVRYYCEDIFFTQNADHRLRYGQKSFVWWLRQPQYKAKLKANARSNNNAAHVAGSAAELMSDYLREGGV